jgi:hypothetical protein
MQRHSARLIEPLSNRRLHDAIWIDLNFAVPDVHQRVEVETAHICLPFPTKLSVVPTPHDKAFDSSKLLRLGFLPGGELTHAGAGVVVLASQFRRLGGADGL